MRTIILQIAEKQKLSYQEQPLPLLALQDAQEVFLTNSIQGMQSVGSCQIHNQTYKYPQIAIAQRLIVAIFPAIRCLLL